MKTPAEIANLVARRGMTPLVPLAKAGQVGFEHFEFTVSVRHAVMKIAESYLDEIDVSADYYDPTDYYDEYYVSSDSGSEIDTDTKTDNDTDTAETSADPLIDTYKAEGRQYSRDLIGIAGLFMLGYIQGKHHKMLSDFLQQFDERTYYHRCTFDVRTLGADLRKQLAKSAARVYVEQGFADSAAKLIDTLAQMPNDVVRMLILQSIAFDHTAVFECCGKDFTDIVDAIEERRSRLYPAKFFDPAASSSSSSSSSSLSSSAPSHVDAQEDQGSIQTKAFDDKFDQCFKL